MDRWGDTIEDGDRAFSSDPESQRGALVWRNLGLLLVMRFAGARRSEVAPLDFADIDRATGKIMLVTKGRAGAKEPVVLLPIVGSAIAKYVLETRPYERRVRSGALIAIEPVDETAVFLSHSVNSYGRRISSETIRYVVDQVRPALEEPWRSLLRPHLLRHSFAHDLQKIVGPFGGAANMRHHSVTSMDAYRDSALGWADQLVQMNAEADEAMKALGVVAS